MSRAAPVSLAAVTGAIRAGDLDVEGHVEAVRAGLATVDHDVHALVDEPGRVARLRADAEQLLEQYAGERHLPPLFGVVVGLKDAIRVEGLPTRLGSRLPAEAFDGPEASLVLALRRAGALVLGKTAMDELGLGAPPTTRNPHDLGRTPGGSSGGSAAAVASGLCPLAIGTQILRGTIGPASFCGVVGYAPSFGRVPLDGVVTSCPSLETAGIFTAEVADATLAASVLVPRWKHVVPARRPVLGVPEGSYLADLFPEAAQAFESAVRHLESSWYAIRRVEMPWGDDLDALYAVASELVHAELAERHAGPFARHPELFGARAADAVRRGLAVPESVARAHRAGRIALRTALERAMDAAGVDLFASPSAVGAAPEGLAISGFGATTVPWAYAGLPSVSLPASTSAAGLPIGFQCIGRFGDDERLLAWATRIDEVLRAS